MTPTLITTLENFFIFKGVERHEVSDMYVVYLSGAHTSLEEANEFSGKEGPQYLFRWVPLTHLAEVLLKPPILADIIRAHSGPYQRHALDERPNN